MKVVDAAVNVLPGVGLAITDAVAVVAPRMRPQNASARQHDSKIRMWERRIRPQRFCFAPRARKCVSWQFGRKERPQAILAVVTSSLNGLQEKLSTNCIIDGPLFEPCCIVPRRHRSAAAWMLMLSQPGRSLSAYRQDKAMQQVFVTNCFL